MSVTEAGSLVNIEFKIPNSWVRFSYKFSYINDNEEYVEKEDEFDRKEEEQTKTGHIQLNKAVFDSLPEHSFQAQQSSVFLPPHPKLLSFKLKSKDDGEDEEEEEEERKVIENDIESSDSKNEIQEEESDSTPKGLEEEEENNGKFIIEPEAEGEVEGEFNEDSNQASII